MAIKKEYKIGEVFSVGLSKLKCMEKGGCCDDCFFFINLGCSIEDIREDIIGHCSNSSDPPDYREDKKSVIFVKVE